MEDIQRGIIYTPAGFTGPPQTVKEALEQGRAVLEEEGRWCQGDEVNTDGDKPFCGSWQACAVGAVAVCLLGVEQYYSNSLRRSTWRIVSDRDSSLNKLYIGAVDALDDATADLYDGCELPQEPFDQDAQPEYEPFYGVVDKNDHNATTRDEVIAVFDAAIQNIEDAELDG